MAEAPDINVDELRRRARRRLVGAIVLALAAAVIVPMLLESDPKPLGDDVSVKIPPVDNGKFVNRLSDKGAKRDRTRRRSRAEGDVEGSGEGAKCRRPVSAPPASAAVADRASEPSAAPGNDSRAEEVDRAGRAEDAGRVAEERVAARGRRAAPTAAPAAAPAPPRQRRRRRPPTTRPRKAFRCSLRPSPTTKAPTRWPTS